MRVLKKLPVIMIFLFLFILNSYICLASEYIYVQDEANILSEDIESLILNSQQEMKEKSGGNIFVITKPNVRIDINRDTMEIVNELNIDDNSALFLIVKATKEVGHYLGANLETSNLESHVRHLTRVLEEENGDFDKVFSSVYEQAVFIVKRAGKVQNEEGNIYTTKMYKMDMLKEDIERAKEIGENLANREKYEQQQEIMAYIIVIGMFIVLGVGTYIYMKMKYTKVEKTDEVYGIAKSLKVSEDENTLQIRIDTGGKLYSCITEKTVKEIKRVIRNLLLSFGGMVLGFTIAIVGDFLFYMMEIETRFSITLTLIAVVSALGFISCIYWAIRVGLHISSLSSSIYIKDNKIYFIRLVSEGKRLYYGGNDVRGAMLTISSAVNTYRELQNMAQYGELPDGWVFNIYQVEEVISYKENKHKTVVKFKGNRIIRDKIDKKLHNYTFKFPNDFYDYNKVIDLIDKKMRNLI